MKNPFQMVLFNPVLFLNKYKEEGLRRTNLFWKPQLIYKEHISSGKQVENRSGTCVRTSHYPGEGDINNRYSNRCNKNLRKNHSQ